MSDVVQRAKTVLEGTTDGPWEIIGGGEYVTGVGILVAPDDGGVTSGDAEFIAQARTLVPELVAEVERLQAARRDESRYLVETHNDRADLLREVERLRATVERVRELAHNPETWSGTQVVTVSPRRILAALDSDR
ncbi:hypothetical protein [Mycolicibacterium fortuitum]